MSPDRHVFFDLPAWQAMLDRERDLFQELRPGSRIGLVLKDSASVLGGRYSSAAAARFDDDSILVWGACEDGMRASIASCCGTLSEAGVDLILVVDDEALSTIRLNFETEPLGAMKRLIRRGNILFYVTRTKNELRDAGYEDFLDSLGLAFLGACR